MSFKKNLLLGASLALAMTATVPAVAANECGSINTASNPQTVTCTGAFNPYASGITYDENSLALANRGNLQIKLAATGAVTTTGTGITATGASGFAIDVQAMTGSHINAGAEGIFATNTGGGTASITNSGTIVATTNGLYAVSNGGLATVTNASGASLTVSGASAHAGLWASGTSAALSNLGAVSVDGASGSNTIYGLLGTASGSSGSLTLSNTGTLSVKAASGAAYGFASGGSNAGAVTYTNNGSVTVMGGTGGATGFYISGGTSVLLTNASTASGVATTKVTGSGSLTGVSVANVTGMVNVGFSGATLSLNDTAGSATGITVSGGVGDSVTVSNFTSGSTVYGGDMSITGSTSAIGVSLASNTGSANAVSFSGASLTVKGGSLATGVSISGGSTGTVSFDASSLLTVSASSGTATGASIAGSGALSGSFGTTINVTNVAGSANGVVFSGGTTQTLTLTSATVKAAGGSAYGVYASSASDFSTLHASGTISVTASGSGNPAVGLYFGGGHGVTVDGAPTVTVAGDDSVYGVSVDGTAGPITATIGNITVSSTAADVTGVNLVATGGISLTDAGVIDLTGSVYNYGVYTSAGGPLSLSLNTVALHGAASTGSGYGVGAFNISAGNDITTVTVQSVSVDGLNGIGIAGLASSGGAATLTIGSVSGTTHSGGVTTTGSGGIGVSFTGQDGLLTVTNNGTIATSGDSATGLALISTGTGGMSVSSWNVTTTGASSSAITLSSTGAGNISLSSTTVSTKGASSLGISLSSTGTGAASVTSDTVTATGDSAAGIVVATNGTAANVTSNSVTTSGVSSNAIDVSTGAGKATINSTTASTSGSGSYAIAAASTSGTLAVTSAKASTTGANADALHLASTSGTINLTSTTATTSGNSADAIDVSSTTGLITVASTMATTTGTGADAIHLVSTSTGNATISLGDGSVTSASSGNGVYVNTGGTATINLGVSAKTASISGSSWAISSTAAGGSTLNLSGTVTGTAGTAINLKGGPSSITNAGVLNGTVDLTDSSDSVTNSGTWNLYGGNAKFGAGTNVLSNSGTINVGATATTAQTTAMSGLTTFANSGTVNLQQGHTGDVLNLGSAAYTGSGSAKILIDVNLAATAVGGSAAQSADLVTAGSASGTTTIVATDLGAGLPGQFNFAGIPLVTASSSSSGAFVLQGGAIDKGYVSYDLAKIGSNYLLVGLPAAGAFETARAEDVAERFWRRSSAVWADEMRLPGFVSSTGWAVWGQFNAMSETNKSAPAYSLVTTNNSYSFTPNLDIATDWMGGQLGVDYGFGDWAVGATGGFGTQRDKFKTTSDHLDVTGFNIGAYIRFTEDGFFVNGLAKYDGYTLKQRLLLNGLTASADGRTVDGMVQVGYRWQLGDYFIEPSGALTIGGPDIDALNSTGVSVVFPGADSVYGSIGARAGLTDVLASWQMTYYVGAYAEGELSAKNSAIVTSGGSSLTFADSNSHGLAKLEAGAVAHTASGLDFNAGITGEVGSTTNGIGGRVGLTWHP